MENRIVTNPKEIEKLLDMLFGLEKDIKASQEVNCPMHDTSGGHKETEDNTAEFPNVIAVYFGDDGTTCIKWTDGTETKVRPCEEDKDKYSEETGLALCFMKKLFGNGNEFKSVIKVLRREAFHPKRKVKKKKQAENSES